MDLSKFSVNNAGFYIWWHWSWGCIDWTWTRFSVHNLILLPWVNLNLIWICLTVTLFIVWLCPDVKEKSSYKYLSTAELWIPHQHAEIVMCIHYTGLLRQGPHFILLRCLSDTNDDTKYHFHQSFICWPSFWPGSLGQEFLWWCNMSEDATRGRSQEVSVMWHVTIIVCGSSDPGVLYYCDYYSLLTETDSSASERNVSVSFHIIGHHKKSSRKL